MPYFAAVAPSFDVTVSASANSKKQSERMRVTGRGLPLKGKDGGEKRLAKAWAIAPTVSAPYVYPPGHPT
ncbi:hypothetical protein ACTXT7_002547 [Hymenolepis weldensis]